MRTEIKLERNKKDMLSNKNIRGKTHKQIRKYEIVKLRY